MSNTIRRFTRIGALAGAATIALGMTLAATPQAPQPTARQSPRNDSSQQRESAQSRVQRIVGAMNELVTGGRVTAVQWSEDGASVSFNRGRERFTFDLTARTIAPVEARAAADNGGRPGRRNPAGNRGAMPARGRQRDREPSPDGRWIAVCRDWNVVIDPIAENNHNAHPITVTTEGHRKLRYGTASWVYGEELDQRDAMWWSPDASKLAFYEFDERKVPDHFITAGLTDLHTRVLTEGYPKPGEPNPIANLQIYHLETGSMARVEQPAEGEWYTYAVQWSPDGSSLLFNRTNRRQDVLHVMAADPDTGKTRTIVTEKQETWQDNRPLMRFLSDGERFIWETEKTGWKHYQLRHLNGELISELTTGDFPALGIEKIDEENGILYYTAFSEPTCPLNAQLHRVNFDGSDQRRLTQEPLNHSVQISPDNKWFITTFEAADTPPASVLYSMDGERVATLAESDRSRLDQMGLAMPELFTFKADDGVTDLYGVLYKPSNFDPNRKYPLVLDVYGGPASQGLRNRFTPANASCEYGFLIARMENRGTVNRGKAFESATYLELGEKDIKDQADGVRFLAQRPYVDGERVGIHGHSYGGYMAALGILKHPDVFHVAVAGAPVTDWKNYDTIYTERYMRTPQENPDGYEIGSCLKYARNLKGKLLIVHGMVDDNVHPNNAFQLIDALQQADLAFDMMLYPNYDHGIGGNYSALRWRYLREHLRAE